MDILIEYDRTGHVSDNLEKLKGLDMFLNLGRHLVNRTPIHCLKQSAFHKASETDGKGAYDVEVIVLFVCPKGKLTQIMAGADRILTGCLLIRERFPTPHQYVTYEGRNRIVFCEDDAFGNLVADLEDHERWLRLPAARRPAPPKPCPASREMWQLPELPPGDPHEEDEPRRPAPTRKGEDLRIVPWKHPTMLRPASPEPDPEEEPFG